MSNLRNALSRTGVFTVPVAGLYLLSLHLCSQDRKKVEPHQHLARLICPKHCSALAPVPEVDQVLQVLVSLRQNDAELASLYDQVSLYTHLRILFN